MRSGQKKKERKIKPNEMDSIVVYNSITNFLPAYKTKRNEERIYLF